MKSSSCEFVFLSGHLPVRSSSVRSSSISNQSYKSLVGIFSLDFKFRYFPGGGGWSGEIKIKAYGRFTKKKKSWNFPRAGGGEYHPSVQMINF